MAFDVGNLIQLQTLAFPLIKTLGGPDIPADYLTPAGDKLVEAGAALHQAATVLDLAGKALADGYLSQEEIDLIIGQAESAADAIQALVQDDAGDQPIE